MRITVTDQFGTTVPHFKSLCAQLGQLEGLPDTFTGKVVLYVQDNPLAGLTCEDVSQRLGMPYRTVADMCQRGVMAAYRYPKRWRIPTRALNRLGMGGDHAGA